MFASRTTRRIPVAVGLIALLGVFGAAVFAAATSPEALFLSESQTAMEKMIAGIEIRPSGNVDVDFAAMMNPLHQGALDMAQAELRHGSNEQLRRIAQEIIVDQQQEISAMRLAPGEPLPPSNAAPDEAPLAALPFKLCKGSQR